ncbi:MAG: hypothetical protein NC343_07500 [Muribaculum sp.]|nr:hypothetical protein [Muribaculaceae bacterium]MCM1081579.1 hypothetical protein [Muribaculum sp.]
MIRQCTALIVALLPQLAMALDTEYVYIAGKDVDRGFEISPEHIVAVEARAALLKEKMPSLQWGIAWNCDSADFDYVLLKFTENDDDELQSGRTVTAVRGCIVAGRDSIIHAETFTKGFDYARGFNSLACEWRDGALFLAGGRNHTELLFTLQNERPPSKGYCRIISSENIDLECVVIENSTAANAEELTDSRWTKQRIDTQFAMTADPLEGYWEYFDLKAEYDKARPGGRYRLAIIRSDENSYDMLYIDGARTNANRWKPLMRKGRLLFTPFQDNYTLEWYDAMMQPVDNEVGANATVENRALLSLNFPLFGFTLRLAKSK